jgi:hypothetical protein
LRKKRTVASVRSRASALEMKPRSAPMMYDVSAKPTAAMLAGDELG